MSFDPFWMILHLFDDLNDENQTNQEQFAAMVIGYNGTHYQKKPETWKTHKSLRQ